MGSLLRRADAVRDPYAEMERIIGGLVECYAIPHARMCMRWSLPTAKAYREEIVGWLEDYARSFPRLAGKGEPEKEDLASFARRNLDSEVRRIVRGEHAAVEKSYVDLFG